MTCNSKFTVASYRTGRCKQIFYMEHQHIFRFQLHRVQHYNITKYHTVIYQTESEYGQCHENQKIYIWEKCYELNFWQCNWWWTGVQYRSKSTWRRYASNSALSITGHLENWFRSTICFIYYSFLCNSGAFLHGRIPYTETIYLFSRI